ncbi:MAG: hypothetical protein AAGD22_18520 [Verrucomicrobiota bacterium]
MKTNMLTVLALGIASATFFAFTDTAEAGGHKYSKPSYSKSYGSGYSRGYSSRSSFAKPAYPYHGSSKLRKSYSYPSYSRAHSYRPSFSYSYRPSYSYSRGYSSRSYCR